MSQRFVRRADPLVEAAQTVWVLLRVVLAAAAAIAVFLVVAAGYFLVPLFMAAAGLARLATRVHWSYSLLALASVVVAGGVAVEAAVWDAAPGSAGAIAGGLYWVAASVVMLGFLLITSRSARRERRLEEAITAHSEQLQQAAHSLREAEERFNTLAATSPDGIAVVDARGNVLLFNGAICEMFGYEPAEMERLNVDRLAPSDERERVRAFRASLLELNGASARIETRHLRKDGSVIDVELSAFPYRDSGEAAGLLIELRDISERKRVQAETERQARQQAALAELGVSALKTSDASWLMQAAAALVCTTLDVEHCAVMELDPEQNELVLRAGAGWSDGLVGEAGEPLIEGSQAVHALLATEQPVSFTDLRSETRFSPMPLLRAHGVLSGLSVVIEGSGKPLGVLGAFSSRPREFAANDAHFLQAVANVLASAVERAAAERAVRDSETRFRQMIETAKSGIALLDMKGQVLLANSAAAEMLGYTEQEIADLRADESRWPNITEFVRPADAEQIAGLLEAQVRDDDDIPTHFQFEAIRRDGRKIDVDVSYSVLTSEEGAPAGALIEVRDITEDLRLRERLFQSQKSEALGTLVAGVAHDFNNLLTVIAGGIELEMERAAGESPWLKSAHTATERAEGIVRQLLQFSRRGSPTRAPIDLVELARETVSLASETFDRRIDVRLDAPKRLPPVIGDRGQLHQVLMNLLVNARDAVTERVDVAGRDPDYRPAITVALTPRESATDDAERRVELVVRDNGSGIPREVQDRIFDPILHHKGDRTGHGPRPLHRLWHRRRPWRDDRGSLRARPGRDLRGSVPVGSRGGARQRQRARAGAAAKAARGLRAGRRRRARRRSIRAGGAAGRGLRGGGRDERRRGAAPRGTARL